MPERVHAIAKKLGITSCRMLKALKERQFDVISIHSTIDNISSKLIEAEAKAEGIQAFLPLVSKNKPQLRRRAVKRRPTIAEMEGFLGDLIMKRFLGPNVPQIYSFSQKQLALLKTAVPGRDPFSGTVLPSIVKEMNLATFEAMQAEARVASTVIVENPWFQKASRNRRY